MNGGFFSRISSSALSQRERVRTKKIDHQLSRCLYVNRCGGFLALTERLC
jgi:hypothetical protein